MNITLPAEAFAGGKLPLFSCYVSTDGGTTWQAVSQLVQQSSSVPYCVISGQGIAVRNLQIVSPNWWRYYVVAMW